MTGSARTPPEMLTTLLAALLAPAFVFGLTACSPGDQNGSGQPNSSQTADPESGNDGTPGSPNGDPDSGTDGSGTGGDEKDPSPGSDEGSWGNGGQENDPTKSAELPKGFPSDEFALPKGAIIDNAGQRAPGNWYVVLRAKNGSQADSWWDRLIAKNGFATKDASDTEDGGRSATLRSGTLTIDALTIIQDDGSVLLSYDIGPNVG